MALAWGPTRKTYTVAELNAAIRGLLGSEFNDIWVAGEISGSKTASSGHCYFTLKDHDAQLRCVCFRASLRYLKFKPRDGIAVLARGRIDGYETRAMPRRSGMGTAPSGAVTRDIPQILSRRFPGLHIRLYPATVQGEGSIE